MALIVQKYGGTSVGDLKKIDFVARKIIKARAGGENRLVVIVSAMAGETDRLLRMSEKLSPSPPGREIDLLLSAGERVSSALLAIRLEALGAAALSLSGRAIGMITDSTHTKARIKKITAERIHKALDDEKIVVVAGFQGIDETNGEVTTLGRGGSDTSAVAVAAAIGADLLEIYTDVLGVMTADPAIEPKARLIERLEYNETLEMSSLGAKVLQLRSVELGKRYNIPIVVKSTFIDGAGTTVKSQTQSDEPMMESATVTAIASDKNQSKITIKGVKDRPGIAALIFGAVAKAAINVDMIIQNVSSAGVTDISFTVARSERAKTVATLEPILPEFGAASIAADDNIGKISIIGIGMRSHPGVAADTFKALAGGGINIMMISTSEIKISMAIDVAEIDRATRILHDQFELAVAPADRARTRLTDRS